MCGAGLDKYGYPTGIENPIHFFENFGVAFHVMETVETKYMAKTIALKSELVSVSKREMNVLRFDSLVVTISVASQFYYFLVNVKSVDVKPKLVEKF